MGSRRLAVVLAVCVAGAVATSRLAVHVPPSRPVLALAALAATAVLLVPERFRKTAAIGGALACGLASAHVLLRPGMPEVHDPGHVWGLWAYARAVRGGSSIAPMWIHDLDAGIPLLQFYGPISFLLDLPGVFAGLTPVALWKEAMTQSAVLSALGALFAARLLGAGWRGATIAACAMAFSPWKLTNFHFRGALGEATAFAFTPVAAASCLRLIRGPSRAAAIALATSVALLIPTHLITLFCLGLLLVPAILLERPLARLPAAAIPALIGAGIVGGWWVPVLAEGGLTSLPIQTQINKYFTYEEHGLDLADMLVRREWDTARPSIRRSDRAAGQEGQQMPFYIGAVLFGAALTAPWWSRSRATWGLAASAAASLVLASLPAADLMTHVAIVHKIQFPWRFLSGGSVFAALAVGVGAAAVLEREGSWKKAWAVLALPVLLVADAAPYTGAAGWFPPYRDVTHWVMRPGSRKIEPFDVRMQAAPVRMTGDRFGRVAGLELPPADTATDIALFWVAYPEWTTPPIYRALQARDPREFGEAAVSWFFSPTKETPVPIAAKPYASILTREGVELDAGPVLERRGGRIEIRAAAPPGGARLVVREQAFPGWTARVDEREAAIEATPTGFMVLALPQGTHTVRLAYGRGTPSRRLGLLVTSLTFAGLPAFFWIRRSRARSSSRRG